MFAVASRASQPSLDQIYGFISKINLYPVSAGQLLDFAKDVRAPREIIRFYERFAKDQVFDDQEDLTCRSEQVEIMRSDQADMPSDGLCVPAED